MLSFIAVSCGKKGCTDSSATNYDPNATKNDGSCVYPPNNTTTPTTSSNPCTTTYTQSCNYSVDGVSKVSSSFYASVSPFDGKLSIQAYVGAIGSTPSMAFIFDTTVTTGSYIPGGGLFADFNSFNYVKDPSTRYGTDGSTGNISITKHDVGCNIIEGTFSAKCYYFNSSTSSYTDSVNVTSGTFAFKY